MNKTNSIDEVSFNDDKNLIIGLQKIKNLEKIERN
jgi:hypothetical protein